MVYVDTSVLMPLFLIEPHSVAAADRYAREKSEFVAAAWCIPEFATALGIKQRTGAIDAPQAQGAWTRFERMVAAWCSTPLTRCALAMHCTWRAQRLRVRIKWQPWTTS